MLGLIALVTTFIVSWVSYGAARRFVHEKINLTRTLQVPGPMT